MVRNGFRNHPQCDLNKFFSSGHWRRSKRPGDKHIPQNEEETFISKRGKVAQVVLPCAET